MRIAHLYGTGLSPVLPKVQLQALHITDFHQSLNEHESLASTWQYDLAARIQHAEDNEDDMTLQEYGAVPKVYESDEDIDGDEVMQYIMSSMDAAHSRQAACMTKMEAIKASTSGGRGDGDSGVWRSISDCVLDDSLTIPAGLPEYGFTSVFDDIMTDDVFF